MSKANASKKDIFTFHVSEDPASLDPRGMDRFTGQYVLGNLYRGLLRIDEDNNLVPELAKSCKFTSTTVVECELRENHWSNGKKIPLALFKDSILRQLRKEALGSLKEYLIAIRNVPEYLAGKAKLKDVGIQTVPPNILRFQLRHESYDFLYALAHPALSPLPADVSQESLGRDFATGPYHLKEWRKGRSLLLEPNPYYWSQAQKKKNQRMPLVEVFFVNDDSTALSLFQKGRLNLLRRMPPEAQITYQKDPRLKYYPFVRFDYIGFGGRLKNKPKWRRAFGETLDYKEFQKIFFAKGRPGCASLPKQFMRPWTCYTFQKNKKFTDLEPLDGSLDLYFSHSWNDDLFRTMQWVQNQWVKNLPIKISMRQEELKLLTHHLQTDPPDIFRRGVPLDRPSCLAALQVFTSDSPDNFVGWKDKKYDELVRQLGLVKWSKNERRDLCGQAFKRLMDAYVIIPLGEIHLPMLSDGDFAGWTINSLNQIDLSRLHISQHVTQRAAPK